MLAIKITTDGRIIPVSLSTEDVNRSIWDELDGYYDIIRLDPQCGMLVDDEGMLKGKPENPRASRIAGMTIVGTALLIGLEMTDDGEDFCQVPRWAMESLLKGADGA